MDSRDSSSSSSSSSIIVAKDGGGVANADKDLLLTASLAKEASALFQSEKFAECVEILQQLLQKNEADPKILHNVAVALYLRDECSDPKKLVEVLIDVKGKSEDLARVSREQTDPVTHAANKSILGIEGHNDSTNDAYSVFADKVNASVAALNIAIILFQLHEYSKALSVLVPLFHNIELIDKTTALRVCLLLLDVAFLTQDASKFSDVINYLDKTFGGSAIHQQMPNLVSNSSSVPNHSSTSDDFYSEATFGGNASEGSLSRTASDETMEYETLLLSTLDISRPSNIPLLSDTSSPFTDRSTATINLKLQLPLYKIQHLLLTRNLKAAKREVKQAMNIAREVDSSRALLLKSQLEYFSGNYSKAFKLLRASGSQLDVASSIIINNNIGCIYYQQGKPHTSSIFFHKALTNCSFLWKEREKPRKLATFSQDKSLLIAYNCGLQYLACGKPLLAARCFLRASLVLYNRPLLWLRLAESCLLAMEKGSLKYTENFSNDLPVKVHVIGQGKWRQLAFENGPLKNGDNFVFDRNAKLKLSLPFARQCLLNALHLLSGFESKSMKCGTLSTKYSKENESSDPKAPKNKNSIDPMSQDMGSSGVINENGDSKEQRGGVHPITEYEDVYRRENQKIKQAILINLAFVELELGNPLKALSWALSLINLSECSRMYTFWGHVYAAEALCLMNRPNNAAEHFSTYVSGSSNVELPYSEEDCLQWQSKKIPVSEDSSINQIKQHDNVCLSPEAAQSTLYVNLASMYATLGDFEQASRLTARALAIAPNSQKAALMAVFLDLKLGKAQEGLSKLKRWCRVRFLPAS
ncbi:hypothetical protein KSS87_011069 [Heliosperma pusillum]|nr:hypothetical protein KSS87_011069 [Heliosperma pusillum]